MEFHGIFHGNPWNTCVVWNGAHLIPWKSRVLSDFLFGTSRVPWNSMEYHTEVQGNMVLNKMTIPKFHGIPLNQVIFHLAAPNFHGIPRNIPWNYIIWNVVWNGALLIPWNPMELGDFLFATPEFHGIPWNIPCKSRVTWYWIKWQSQSSMEFHGTKLYFIWCQRSMAFHGIFHGIPWNICVIWNGALLIPWNLMELGDFSFGGTRVPWNSIEYSMELHGTPVSFEMEYSMEFHGIFVSFEMAPS